MKRIFIEHCLNRKTDVANSEGYVRRDSKIRAKSLFFLQNRPTLCLRKKRDPSYVCDIEQNA